MTTNHPHNNFFEKVFSMLDVTTDFLNQLLEEKYRKHLDLSELKILDKKHIHENLRKTESDLIFEAALKGKNRIRIALLLEHKSSPPVNPHIQINHYISSIHQSNILHKESPTFVLPILFYHGKGRWKKKPFSASFQDVPEIFHQFIPNFEYILIDLDEWDDSFIENLSAGFLKNALLILKHSGDKEYLIENAARIFAGIEKFEGKERRIILYEMLINYLILITNLKNKEMKQVSAQLPPETTKVFFSTADRLRAEGKIEGKIEGFEINDLLKSLEVSLNLMTQFKKLPMEKIAKLAATNIDFVKKVKAGFEKGDEKKVRKVVFNFFKKFEDLDENIVEKLEKIIKEFVPKFQED